MKPNLKKLQELLDSEPLQDAIQNPKEFTNSYLFAALDFVRREMIKLTPPQPPDERQVARMQEAIQKERTKQMRKLAKMEADLLKMQKEQTKKLFKKR